jgi:hypothetical protein
MGYEYALIFPFASDIMEVFYIAILRVPSAEVVGIRLMGLNIIHKN